MSKCQSVYLFRALTIWTYASAQVTSCPLLTVVDKHTLCKHSSWQCANHRPAQMFCSYVKGAKKKKMIICISTHREEINTMLLASHSRATVNLIKQSDHMLGILMEVGIFWREKTCTCAAKLCSAVICNGSVSLRVFCLWKKDRRGSGENSGERGLKWGEFMKLISQ